MQKPGEATNQTPVNENKLQLGATADAWVVSPDWDREGGSPRRQRSEIAWEAEVWQCGMPDVSSRERPQNQSVMQFLLRFSPPEEERKGAADQDAPLFLHLINAHLLARSYIGGLQMLICFCIVP